VLWRYGVMALWRLDVMLLGGRDLKYFERALSLFDTFSI